MSAQTPETRTALEQSFIDFCTNNRVRAVSLHCSLDTSEGHRFYTYAHPEGEAKCVSAHGPTIEAALTNTVAALSKPAMLADEALPVELAA